MSLFIAHLSSLASRLLLSLAVVLLLALPASAGTPHVRFDASTTIECVDITPDDFAAAYPRDMVVEAKFRVSVLVDEGSEADVEDVTITLASPQQRLRVADFAPRTETASDYTGQIETTSKTESHRSAEASIKGLITGFYGPATAQATPSAAAGTSKHTVTNESFRKLPTKNLVVASGTVQGEAGVFFKLKRSSQVPLEGTREYTVLLVVPRDWRGDGMTLTCEARGYSQKLLVRKLANCGQVQQPVGLYLTGDAEARRAAFRLSGMSHAKSDDAYHYSHR